MSSCVARDAGGQQFIGGGFLQDVFTPTPQWEIVGSVRTDYWLAYDGERTDTPPAAGIPASQIFPNRDKVIVSPRLAALWHATPSTDLRASVYQGFRVPTINELYRVFRVRSDVTVANPELLPEQSVGGELGIAQRWGPFQGRFTGYWNDVKDLVTNVTLSTPLPDCPPGTTCRQRQNLDLSRIRGFEVELELVPAPQWRLLASYIFTDARVVTALQQPQPRRQSPRAGAPAGGDAQRALREPAVGERFRDGPVHRRAVRGRSEHTPTRQLLGLRSLPLAADREVGASSISASRISSTRPTPSAARVTAWSRSARRSSSTAGSG